MTDDKVFVTHHYDKSTGLQWLEKDGVLMPGTAGPLDPIPWLGAPKTDPNAEVAQLDERHLTTVEAVGSSPALGTNSRGFGAMLNDYLTPQLLLNELEHRSYLLSLMPKRPPPTRLERILWPIKWTFQDWRSRLRLAYLALRGVDLREDRE